MNLKDYNKYEKYIYKILNKCDVNQFKKSGMDRDDLQQEFRMKLVKVLNKYETIPDYVKDNNIGSKSTYVYASLKNHLLTCFIKNKRNKNSFLTYIDTTKNDLDDKLIDYMFSYKEFMERIAELDVDYKKTFNRIYNSKDSNVFAFNRSANDDRLIESIKKEING